MTDEGIDPARADGGDEGAHPGRRAFMAGAAGLAAGATLLGAASPASALGTTGEYTLPLKWIDFSDGSIHSVAVGSQGYAKVLLSAFGDMAAASIRVVLAGTGIDAGQGPWTVLGEDLPSGFQPVPPWNDGGEAGNADWGGVGQVLNFQNAFQNVYPVFAGWTSHVESSVNTARLVWSLPDKHNDGSGSVLFNYAGTVPYGSPLGEGTFVFTTLVYLVNMPEPE